MADPRSTASDDGDPSGEERTPVEDERDRSGDERRPEDGPGDADSEELTTEELRERVEQEYDFDNFTPSQMREMSVEEWEAAFDEDSWITGDELLDRVSEDLRSRIARREVFAVLEEVEDDGQRRLLAYSDEGYALVYPDGTVEGFGTVLRDVKPTIALCSMDSYETPDPPDDDVLLPTPEEVPEASGEFGNLMLQVTAGTLLLAGLVLAGAWLLLDGLSVFAPALGVFFVLVGLFLFASVANARLSDRFRAEEYRQRLRAVGLEDGERPEFLPVEDGEVVGPDRRGTATDATDSSEPAPE